jgi:hypothetical protein
VPQLLQLDEYNSVGRELGRKVVGGLAVVGVGPEIADIHGAADAKVGPFRGDRGGGVTTIEQADGMPAIGERTGPDFKIAILRGTSRLFAEGILIDGDYFLIGEDVQNVRRDIAQIVACK